MPAPRSTSPALWPVLVALGAAAVVAAVVVVLAISASGFDEREPGPLGAVDILVAVPVGDGVVRVVTEEGGCRHPVFADVRARADAVELRVMGQSPGGGCTADIKVECHEVLLPASAAGKRLVAVPVAERTRTASEESLARQYASGGCSRLRVR